MSMKLVVSGELERGAVPEEAAAPSLLLQLAIQPCPVSFCDIRIGRTMLVC